MMKIFDAIVDNVKEMHSDLSSIVQKVDAHVVMIKQLKQHLVTTREGKQTIDPPMQTEMENAEKVENEVELVEEPKDDTKKESERHLNRGYVKFMKNLVTEKRVVGFKIEDKLQHCSTIATRSLVLKKEDPGALTIQFTIGILHFAKALCDLSASINLMPLSIYKKLGLRTPKPTTMRLLIADRIVKRPIGVL
ncbi:uncharacterized protein LOC125833340 [Solanum verrucosum]|uniref:uncharacterized protein LOC125833340 n=1 Tax=Solanum verrucosum TaxID=315347 RepID=UPI0020D09AA9|nr:uncharacterized protein LOC125833340 [Solanum verrucosum]